MYVKSQKGEMPMMVKDAARLDPATVQLWNGEKWTRVLGWSKSHRNGEELELVLRSGERISCTPTHKWPTRRGVIAASEIQVGDVLEQVRLPQPEKPSNPDHIGMDIAWFLGVYLAEGSRADDTIQISGHADEIGWVDKLRPLAASYGGSLTLTLDENKLNIRMYGRVLAALVDDHISGNSAHDKGLKVKCWMRPNEWLDVLLQGYLAGDGHWDSENKRWRLGFARNYNLERDLRVLAARLGFTLTLNLATATNQDGEFPSFRGEIRFEGSDHRNCKARAEVVEIRRARCREVWDIGVENDPHLFALASGILTHNSKPNPMPESVRDRPTDAYEHILMLTKSARYFWDAEAVSEPITDSSRERLGQPNLAQQHGSDRVPGKTNGPMKAVPPRYGGNGRRNLRNVWTFATQPYKGAHFATFPEELARRCIKAASRPGDIVLDPFAGSGTTAAVAQSLGRRFIIVDVAYQDLQRKRIAKGVRPVKR